MMSKRRFIFISLVVILLICGNLFLNVYNAETSIIKNKMVRILHNEPEVKIVRRRLWSERNGSDQSRATPDETPMEAEVQIDDGILTMIKEIEESDTTLFSEDDKEETRNYKCVGKGGTPKDGVEDLLCMEPPTFLNTSKNPCWFSGNRLRCLPYFQVIGVDKSGSTDLFDRVAKHPDVIKNKGTMRKETMWWSWKRYGHWLKNKIPIETYQRYLDYFTEEADAVVSNMSRGYITGDGTPMDLWDNSGWVSIPQNSGLKEPKYITPHLLYHINPAVKMFIILRDPVERLYSDYFFLGLGTMTSAAFHNQVVASIKLLHTCTRSSSLRTCLYSRDLHLKITARLHLGFYPIFIKDWLNVFPREQMLILRTEDYSKSIGDHMKQVFKFLDLRALSNSEMNAIAHSQRKHVTQKKLHAGKMLDTTRAILTRLYQAYNAETAELLRDDKYLWNL